MLFEHSSEASSPEPRRHGDLHGPLSPESGRECPCGAYEICAVYDLLNDEPCLAE
jgi:hypothetical protein